MFRGGVVAVALFGLVLASCGGSATSQSVSSTTRPDKPARTTTTEPTTTTTSLPPTSYATSPIPFTTAEGWQYTFTPDVGVLAGDFTKDIHASPPGLATWRLIVSQAAEVSSFPGEIVATTPGRNAPELRIAARVVLVWPLPSEPDGVFVQPFCGAAYDSPPVSEGPVLRCNVPSDEDGRFALVSDSDEDEALVDAWVALAQGAVAAPPSVVVTITNDSEGFASESVETIVLAPDGSFQVLEPSGE